MNKPVLTKNFGLGHPVSLKEYEASGGYEGLKKAVRELGPEGVVKAVSESGLRGRGGAGFPTGKKWGFLEKESPGPRYYVVNFDEMEPGTFKDRLIVERDPHMLIEGLIIACFALGIHNGYIFIRHEYLDAANELNRAITEAKEAGYLGEDILGSGFGMDITVHRSAGRYECGEETALLDALEGKRPNPRSKPPFPLVKGVWQRPTVVNNVETMVNVPHIITMGPSEWKSLAITEGMAGPKLYGVSGNVNKPGMFELGMGVTLRELIEGHAGGMRLDRTFKACLPGGASTQVLTSEHLDVPMDFTHLEEAGSRLGTGCVTVFDDRCCMVGAAVNLTMFFARESCGWCTPCRDGLQYVLYLLRKLEAGEASEEDVDIIAEQCKIIFSSSFCAFAPGAVWPVQSVLQHFGDEVQAHITQGQCPFKGES